MSDRGQVVTFWVLVASCIVSIVAAVVVPIWAPCWVFEYGPITAMPMRCLRGQP